MPSENLLKFICNKIRSHSLYRQETKGDVIMKEHCGITQDLLPLYQDGVLSKESQVFVEEHLSECEECRTFLEKMETIIITETEKNENKKVLEPFRKLKQLKKRTVIIAVLITVVTCFTCVAGIMYGCAKWLYFDDFFGVNAYEIMEGKHHTDILRTMIAKTENWDETKIEMKESISWARGGWTRDNKYVKDEKGRIDWRRIGKASDLGEGAVSAEWMFNRKITYEGNEYLCYIFAKQTFIATYEIVGYQLEDLDDAWDEYQKEQGEGWDEEPDEDSEEVSPILGDGVGIDETKDFERQKNLEKQEVIDE